MLGSDRQSHTSDSCRPYSRYSCSTCAESCSYVPGGIAKAFKEIRGCNTLLSIREVVSRVYNSLQLFPWKGVLYQIETSKARLLREDLQENFWCSMQCRSTADLDFPVPLREPPISAANVWLSQRQMSLDHHMGGRSD